MFWAYTYLDLKAAGYSLYLQGLYLGDAGISPNYEGNLLTKRF